jgi:L-threonylcarbamoyladenylate synthase
MLDRVDMGNGSTEPTTVMPTDTPSHFRAAVDRAAALLKAGELVALPTETVYGLAANAFDPSAVERIFKVKGRPASNPVIVHVGDMAQARQCVARWPDTAASLARAFWPGPLTLVLPRSRLIPDIVTAGGTTVGVRWPSHPLIQAVIRKCGFPLAAPSANISMRVSPTNAGHVVQWLGGKIPLIVDGGQSQVGIESTVVDLTGLNLRILRPGMIHEASLEAVLGALQEDGTRYSEARTGPMPSPGMMPRHYAPEATLSVLSWANEADLVRQLESNKLIASRTYVLAHTVIPNTVPFAGVSVIPHDPEGFARALYSELHRCNDAQVGWIVVEQVPQGGEWSGIADRLRRASCDQPG